MNTQDSALTAAPDDAPRLERRLSMLDAMMIVVGSMIGSGIFIVSAESSRLVGAPGGCWWRGGSPGS
jgi:APA family basic amino acid/polyamine antiporter